MSFRLNYSYTSNKDVIDKNFKCRRIFFLVNAMVIECTGKLLINILTNIEDFSSISLCNMMKI